MGQRKRHKVISNQPSAAVRKPKVSKWRSSLDSLPAELQLGIVHHLPRMSLPTICQLNKHWRGTGTDELLRRLLPIPPHECPVIKMSDEEALRRAICHFIDTNNVDAQQHLLNFRPMHPYFRPLTVSLLLAEPASLGARVTEEEEAQFCLGSNWSISFCAVNTAFKYNDMSCMRLLIDHGLANYSWLLDKAVDDGFFDTDVRSPSGRWFARPIPGMDSRGSHNSVLHWLLAYPPRHVVQAMLVMWGRLSLHPRLRTLCKCCDRRLRDSSQSCDNMLILAAGRGHPASLQTINELRMMVEILTDDASGGVIAEARQPLTHALRIARRMASMWPGTPPLATEYLQSVCTWEDHQSSSSSSDENPNNPPPPSAPHLILPPQDPVLHRLIDLETYDEMLQPENWMELQRTKEGENLMWLVSTEFLADEEAARRMRCFKSSLRGLHSAPGFMNNLPNAAGAFRRWCCVEVVLGEFSPVWPSVLKRLGGPDLVLGRAILDAMRSEPGCADSRIIRKLLQTGVKNLDLFKGFGSDLCKPDEAPFRGGWFGWEPFRLAFLEQYQDCKQRETAACMKVRDTILDFLSTSDQKALKSLVGEPSKALYQASTRRRIMRLAHKLESGKNAGMGSSSGDSSCGSADSSRGCGCSAYP